MKETFVIDGIFYIFMHSVISPLSLEAFLLHCLIPSLIKASSYF